MQLRSTGKCGWRLLNPAHICIPHLGTTTRFQGCPLNAHVPAAVSFALATARRRPPQLVQRSAGGVPCPAQAQAASGSTRASHISSNNRITERLGATNTSLPHTPPSSTMWARESRLKVWGRSRDQPSRAKRMSKGQQKQRPARLAAPARPPRRSGGSKKQNLFQSFMQ